VYRPDGIDWGAVNHDARISIVLTNSVSAAQRLCAAGQPAIAVLGLSKGALTQWLRSRAVIAKTEMH
jgi:hypothetical protein